MLKRKDGQAAILVTVCLIGIISLLALVVDTGRIFVEHAKLQRAADAAVLAGVQDMPIGRNVNGTVSTEDSVKEIMMQSISYNLNNAEQSYTKDNNLNRFLLIDPQTNDDGSAKTTTITKEAFTISDDAVDIDFVTPQNAKNTAQHSIVAVTISKTIKTRLAQFLGYREWTISAQKIAMIAPMQAVPSVLPLGLLVNSEDYTLPINKTVRIANVAHTGSNVENQLRYVPISHIGKHSFHPSNHFTDGNMSPNLVANVIANSNKKDNTFVYTSTTKNAAAIIPGTADASHRFFKGICEGFNARIQDSVFENSVGCIDSDQPSDTSKLNFAFGDNNLVYGYLNDPRMFIIPIVVKTSAYSETFDLQYAHQFEVKIVGFALFFFQYAHYTTIPPTPSYYKTDAAENKPAMTEMVGYFTNAVFEGPIDPQKQDYGLYGIEYVSANNTDLFGIS